MNEQQTRLTPAFSAIQRKNDLAKTMKELLDHDNDIQWAVLNIAFSCANIVKQW